MAALTHARQPPQPATGRKKASARVPLSLQSAPARMTIGRLAKASGTRVETIRFYEHEGLLPEGARTKANYRLYGEAHVIQLAFIRRCRLLNMPLDEVRILLQFKDRPRKSEGVHQLLDDCLARLAGQIQQLKQLGNELTNLQMQSAGKSLTSRQSSRRND